MEGDERESRVIVSHAPGMVFQYVLRESGRYTMPFASNQALNVLGITAESLQMNPVLFEEIILWKDRKSFRESRAQSAETLSTWNWEGRVWIESYHDVKWVSLRASPRREKGVG
ncbi:MAG TPA: histidine kinase, partial [Nitrosospira sp.]|nr:histidine kinase [Nitrosospira sp.]